LTVPPGGVALPDDDNTANGVPDLLDHLLGAEIDGTKPELVLSFDRSTAPITPLLNFSGRNLNSDSSLEIEYSPDLVTPFAPVYSIVGASKTTVGNTVSEVFDRPGDDKTDYVLRLDPTVLPSNAGFYRVAGQTTGEIPLAIWTFRDESLAPVKLSTLATPLEAAFAATNSGIISSAGSFTFDDPVTSWSGAQIPATGIGTQIQTAFVTDTSLEVTRITYTGFLWSDRPAGATTTVKADIVAWLNGALDSPGIVSTKRILVTANGGTLLTPFSITYPINGKLLSPSDNWDLRLRMEDGNGTAYSLTTPGNREGFGIDTVTIYGKEAP
jgi:hypothetical protein